MKYRKSMILLVLIILIFGAASVCASDVNETVIAGENTSTIELTQADTDEQISLEEDKLINQTENAEPISEENSGTFAELQANIKTAPQGSTLTLNKSYEYENGFDTEGILIDKSITINGNGFKIDAKGTSRIFRITADNVILENIIFTNGKTTEHGGAVYFQKSGIVTNCNFTNNEAAGEKSYGGAIYFNATGNVINSIFTDNKATTNGGAIYVEAQSINNHFSSQFYNNHAGQSGGAIFFHNLVQGNSFECIFKDNYAGYGGGMFFSKSANANRFDSEFINNTAKSCGGAMFFYGTTDKNNFTGSFINNKALGQIDPTNGNGGAITFKNVSTNSIFKCDFINNTAALNGGGVNYRETPQNIIFNCNFINNTAQRGGGVNFFETFVNVIFNGEFIGNSAEDGGALAAGYGTIKNISFKNNHAKRGAAVYLAGSGSAVNCNFTNNMATYRGGAVYISEKGNVVNCSFEGNSATNDGGAICSKSGTFENCNFTGNSASNDGGAVYLSIFGNVTNCHFTDNSAPKGGAVYILNDNGNVINCSFVANTANDGGAVFFMTTHGNVANCYFEANSANRGGAIYCSYGEGITADSCIFKNDSDDTNNSTLILSPILDANDFNSVCGSGKKLRFNLTTNSGMAITNGNISISIYLKGNDEWVANYTCLSGEGWTADLPVGSFYAVFNTEYKGFEPINRTIEITMPDVQFYINVTPVTTTNKTVNITAKSNIPKNLLLDGKFIFILPDGTQIIAIYASNGTWWALHTFEHCAEYNVTASYVGLENVAVKNATITVEKSDSTITLDKVIVNYGDSINVKTEGAIAITAKINGAEISVLDNHVIPLTGLNVGKYNLTITTISDDDHYSVTLNTTITVNPIQTQLIGNAVTATYKANKYLVITLKDANGNPIRGVSVTVVLNGAKTYSTDKNGQVKVSTMALAPKKYPTKVTFNGNANYLKSTKTIKVTVKKATPKLTAKKKTFKKSVKVKKYSITLKYGKATLKKVKVYIKIKGKTYKAKTSSKGKATFKIKKLTKRGTYNAKITFKGNKYYNKVTKKVKIKIR